MRGGPRVSRRESSHNRRKAQEIVDEVIPQPDPSEGFGQINQISAESRLESPKDNANG